MKGHEGSFLVRVAHVPDGLGAVRVVVEPAGRYALLTDEERSLLPV